MISVIIPVYNGEKYIDRCLESIINQTYKKLEILLINDGSIDKTYEKCKAWERKDSRIKSISKKNTGVSDTRNIGIDAARGEYVSFIDIDDEIPINFYQEIKNAFLKSNNIDVVVTNFYEVYSDYKKEGITNFKNKDFLEEILNNNSIMGYVFNKVYKKEILSKQRFNKNIKIYEDLLFNVELFERIESYSFLPNIHYKYYQQSESTMHKSFKNDCTRFYANIEIIKCLKRYKYSELLKDRMYYFIWDYSKNLLYRCSDKVLLKYYLLYYKEYNKIGNFSNIIKIFLMRRLNVLFRR